MSTLNKHLVEIKFRIFYLILSALCTFFLCYNYQIEIIYIVGKPFMELQQTFVFLELTEAFYTLLRISLLITLFLLIPFLFYHLWCFLIPSYYKIERIKINFLFFCFLCLFLCEILFGYFILLPKICHFLISFEVTSEIKDSDFYFKPLVSVEYTARIGSYVKLMIKFLVGIILLCQIPLCFCFLYSKKILQVSSLYSNRKILIILSLVISSFLVPPDIITQLIVAVLFFLIFEFLIFVGLVFEQSIKNFGSPD